MTTNPGFNRTSQEDSTYFRHVPQETLAKIWGPKRKPKDIQDIHFSKDEPESTKINDIEAYAEKTEKAFHKERKETWVKNYIKNYISRNPKGMDLYKI